MLVSGDDLGRSAGDRLRVCVISQTRGQVVHRLDLAQRVAGVLKSGRRDFLVVFGAANARHERGVRDNDDVGARKTDVDGVGAIARNGSVSSHLHEEAAGLGRLARDLAGVGIHAQAVRQAVSGEPREGRPVRCLGKCFLIVVGVLRAPRQLGAARGEESVRTERRTPLTIVHAVQGGGVDRVGGQVGGDLVVTRGKAQVRVRRETRTLVDLVSLLVRPDDVVGEVLVRQHAAGVRLGGVARRGRVELGVVVDDVELEWRRGQKDVRQSHTVDRAADGESNLAEVGTVPGSAPIDTLPALDRPRRHDANVVRKINRGDVHPVPVGVLGLQVTVQERARVPRVGQLMTLITSDATGVSRVSVDATEVQLVLPVRARRCGDGLCNPSGISLNLLADPGLQRVLVGRGPAVSTQGLAREGRSSVHLNRGDRLIAEVRSLDRDSRERVVRSALVEHRRGEVYGAVGNVCVPEHGSANRAIKTLADVITLAGNSPIITIRLGQDVVRVLGIVNVDAADGGLSGIPGRHHSVIKRGISG